MHAGVPDDLFLVFKLLTSNRLPSMCLLALTGKEHRDDVRAVPLHLRRRHARVQGVSRGGDAGAQGWQGYRIGCVLQGQREDSEGVGWVYGRYSRAESFFVLFFPSRVLSSPSVILPFLQ